MSLEKDLQKFFGFDSFREVQHKIVKGALKNHDQLVILPTGSGKSICYQLPGLIQDGYTIIVSPLMSLIKDQIFNLQKKGINAVGIFSGTTQKEKTIIYSKILQDKADFKLIYTTPESIDTNISFINCIMHMKNNNLLKKQINLHVFTCKFF